MRMRTLGGQGLTVSAIGLGCMGMSQAYGPADDKESIAALHRATEVGITLLDTAMSYGSGHNEALLGRAISYRRDQVVLASKVGILRDVDGVYLDAHPDRIRSYCEASLARLGVEHLDLYNLHRVDPAVPGEESIGAMADLVEAGMVRYLGLSEASIEDLRRAVATCPISALQSEWSLWWREIEDDILPTARSLGVGLVSYSPLGRGFLTGMLSSATGDGFAAGDLRRDDPRFHEGNAQRNQAALAAVQSLAADREVTSGQFALAWLLAQVDDVVSIPGTRRADRVAENAAAADIHLTPADLAALEAMASRSAWAGDRRSFAATSSREGLA